MAFGSKGGGVVRFDGTNEVTDTRGDARVDRAAERAGKMIERGVDYKEAIVRAVQGELGSYNRGVGKDLKEGDYNGVEDKIRELDGKDGANDGSITTANIGRGSHVCTSYAGYAVAVAEKLGLEAEGKYKNYGDTAHVWASIKDPKTGRWNDVEATPAANSGASAARNIMKDLNFADNGKGFSWNMPNVGGGNFKGLGAEMSPA